MGGKTKPAYAPEFRQQIVELYATGRRLTELSKEFGCSPQSIMTWVKRAGRLAELPDRGSSVIRTHKQARAVSQAGLLSAQEREELERLRKDVRRLQTERDILAKATAWFAGQGEYGSKGSTRS
jgi:transposase